MLDAIKYSQKNFDRFSLQKYGDLNIFREPVQLISANESKHLSYNDEAIKELRKIEHHVNVVAVVGKYRTGKSLLLNRLAEINGGTCLLLWHYKRHTIYAMLEVYWRIGWIVLIFICDSKHERKESSEKLILLPNWIKFVSPDWYKLSIVLDNAQESLDFEEEQLSAFKINTHYSHRPKRILFLETDKSFMSTLLTIVI